jgi:hypothetical protein
VNSFPDLVICHVFPAVIPAVIPARHCSAQAGLAPNNEPLIVAFCLAHGDVYYSARASMRLASGRSRIYLPPSGLDVLSF